MFNGIRSGNLSVSLEYTIDIQVEERKSKKERKTERERNRLKASHCQRKHEVWALQKYID